MITEKHFPKLERLSKTLFLKREKMVSGGNPRTATKIEKDGLAFALISLMVC